jgi:predicted ATP-dependent protease
MLRRDVLDAAQAGRFHIYAVDHVDQAIALLTGVTAGEAQSNGQYPAGSINHRVASRVAELGALRKAFARSPENKRRKRGN